MRLHHAPGIVARAVAGRAARLGTAAVALAAVAVVGLTGPAASAAGAASAALPAAGVAAAAPAASGDDWLHTSGNKIVDAAGKEVKLTGANWFGFNAGERVFHGLWSGNMDKITRSMADRGINTVRVPISVELLTEWKAGTYKPISVNTYANPELEGKNSKQVFDQFLSLCEKYGLKVVLDVHSAAADNSGHIHPVWWNASFTTEQFYQAWEWVATTYRNNDTIVGADIKNEPHGKADETPRAKWDGSTDADNWKHVAETAAQRILAINPNLLIFVEGNETYPKDGVSWSSTDKTQYHNTWWGGNFRGARQHPIDLGAQQDQLVYSPHDYGPLVFEQPWFKGEWSRATLERDVWDPNWLYLHKEGTSPLLIGEWGGFMDGGPNEKWMQAMADLIVDRGLSHTFWCLNPNSGDTGGLLLNDWASWDEEKYALLKPTLWQSGGKFVSADHQVPLGGAGSTTGISVTELNGGTVPSPSATPSSSPTPSVTPTASPSVSPTGGTGACTAAYRVVNSWSGGFQAEVTVTAAAARSGWTTTFTLPSGVTIGSLWNGTMSGTSPVTVKNLAWNGNIGPAASVTYGFQASGSAPAALAVSCA
ncbi:cellulase family glycosylhydrolase [Myceligenerans crystallogenes]|uniref:Endoglucanase n=1 Tax=Myceligenerans crystallogenes TaxID=316335 RepID=A0ABN2NE81_9MICO